MDGAVVAFSSPAEASAGYGRAASAYLAGRWVSAMQLGLAVGASKSPLAPEGFILAARGAERLGDAPRAKRWWARAYEVGCDAASPCAPRLPREDLFGLTVTLGRFVPVSTARYCSRVFDAEGTVVNGSWYVTPAGEGWDIREAPSRVLVEHVEPPEHAVFVCFSPDGRNRVAVVKQDQSTLFFVGATGERWTGPLPIENVEADSPNTFVADDGRVASYNETGVATVDPGGKTWRDVPWPRGYHATSARMGPPGAFFASLSRDDNVEKGPRWVIARYDLRAGTSSILLKDAGTAVGPVDARGRLVVFDGGAVWLDGMTGKRLGRSQGMLQFGLPADGGLTRESTIVWSSSGNSDEGFVLQDIVTGKDEDVTWVWHAPNGWRNLSKYDPGDIPNMIGGLPIGATGTLGAFHGWTVSQPRSDSVHARRQIELSAPGKEGLRMVLTADRKGAMVMDRRGRFELIGQVSPAFRASASCGSNDAADPPLPSDRAWPLEVCAAALETPGLTAAWLHDIHP